MPADKAIHYLKDRPSTQEAPARIVLPEEYEFREGQVDFAKEAAEALASSEVFIASAPCGIGKSLASLVAILPQLRDSKLVICFRTRDQLQIYLQELRALASGLAVVAFYSKQEMCPLGIKGDLSYYDFSEECRRLRENCELSMKPYCKFYWNNLRAREEAEKLALSCARDILTPREVVSHMARRQFCAYEALKKAFHKVRIFLGTYHYVFDSRIRKNLLSSLGKDLSKVFLIVDEAHNLPSFSRELLSDRLTRYTVENALEETERFKHESAESVRMLLNLLLENLFLEAQRSLRHDELKQLAPQNVRDLFLTQTGLSGKDVAKLIQAYGKHVREERADLGLERISSYNHRVGAFLRSFLCDDGADRVHLILKDRRGRIIMEVRSLDGRGVTDPVLRKAQGSILMSGFLSPPEIYRDLALYSRESVRVREFGSPFPSKNRLILVAKGVTSRFKRRTHKMLEKWQNYIEAISEANEGNIGVFFTSYELMHKVLPLTRIDRIKIVEQRKTRRNDVIKQLSEGSDKALFGVMGGKLSEGIDYPNNILTCTVSVGLPFATWNVYQKALIRYLEGQFPDKGRICAYLAPAILRLVQTCGRTHRSPSDRGCLIILDERVSHPEVKQHLPDYFQKEMTVVLNPLDCSDQIRRFWNGFSHKR
jgi:DNA excision repair protein ERCC-2